MATYRSVNALAERLNDGASKPTFTPHSIRHLIREADSNGLAPHIKRLGRKVLIDEEGFNGWLASSNQP